jgi:hypothetical protein
MNIQKRYWLKGGLISVGIALALFAVLTIVHSLNVTDKCVTVLCSGGGLDFVLTGISTLLFLPTYVLSLPIGLILTLISPEALFDNFATIHSIISLIISYFIIGAIIGLIFRKVKYKNN